MLVSSTTVNNRFCMAISFSVKRPREALAPMLSAPACDGGVVAAQQDVGHRLFPEHSGACILRILQASVGAERLINRASLISQNAGYQADHCVDHHHGRDLTA